MFFAHPFPIIFSPDENYVASEQGILELGTGHITVLEEGRGYTNFGNYCPPILPDELAYSPDGQILAFAGCGTLKLWRARDGVLLNELDSQTYRLVFSLDGTYLLGLGDGYINVWGISTSPLPK